MLLQVLDPATNPLNENDWAFPLLEILHISGFALSIGTIALVDFCLISGGKWRQSAPALLRDTSRFTLFGLVLMLITGPLIFTTDPHMYYYNRAFRFKIGALVLAIIYNYTIHRKVAAAGGPEATARWVAAISLLLWVSVVAGGIFIAFI